VVEGAVDLGEEELEVQVLVALVGGVLTDGAYQPLCAAGRVDADEVQHLALVQLTERTLQVSHPKLFYLVVFSVHQLIIQDLLTLSDQSSPTFNKHCPITPQIQISFQESDMIS
jgi:hypothetical protein